MKKTFIKGLCLLIALCSVFGCMVGCQSSDNPSGSSSTPAVEQIDYVSQLKLDMGSSTKKVEATVKAYVDGDTVHFNVDDSEMPGGVLKARFLAVNTPESTGKIEPYGKAASNFTKETLKKAESIIIESNSANWDADSTGGRYLVWVWYRNSANEEYRNLNVEILQNGLAIASNTGNNIYGSIAMSALNQAKALKLKVHSGVKDPDMYYGEAIELDLKELRTNVDQYNGVKVAFNGVITLNSNNSVYVESYDAETEMYYGMSVYYGYNLNGYGQEILGLGHEVRIVGTVQYYETGGTWQVSDVDYRIMKPDDPNNLQLISKDNEPAYTLTDPARFVNGTVDVTVNDEVVSRPYAQLALSTSITMKNLQVVDVYTTTNEESSSKGAMTLTCKVDGVTVSVRTEVLLDAEGKLITADAYEGKTIDIRGIVDYYNGTYQIRVFSANNITVHD